uniref:Peroxidase n=1 Tax=Urtica dioica TaxID=3501 RepID=Q5QEB4_URTDI|nr:Udp1 peroxidase [Urtica dioica]AAV74522.1 Udp1 peroxidase [Urtica dioica]
MANHPCFSKTILGMALLLLLAAASVHGKVPRIGFYDETCPKAESIVTKAVKKGLKENPRIAPGILRIAFHDCFVRGCDASVLIEGPGTEKTSGANRNIQGYNVIDDAKTELERVCPGVVSCADILTLAARDATVLTGGASWKVPTGRKDGLVSLVAEAGPLPGPRENVSEQIRKLDEIGLNTQDLVVLLGSHTLGTTSCALFRFRLYNFTNATESGADPSIDPKFLPTLRKLCPDGGNGSVRVHLDNRSGEKFDTTFYKNLKRGRGVLQSDQVLWTDLRTQPFVRRLLDSEAYDALNFKVEFGKAMVKMSLIGVKTNPKESEIRKVCTAVNSLVSSY